MRKAFYVYTRDSHLYLGLFFGPFVLLFAASVFPLVHGWGTATSPQQPPPPQIVHNLKIPANLANLDGRPLVDAVHGVLDQIGVVGEVQYIRHIPGEHRLEIPVSVPGRETTVSLDLESHSAGISRRSTGVWEALITLHKAPGPHLAAIRMNWWPMRLWRWFADATAYLFFFISISGIYLWATLRAERKSGLILIAAGALSFFGLVYALAG
jgi:Putative PepSY_TM-like